MGLCIVPGILTGMLIVFTSFGMFITWSTEPMYDILDSIDSIQGSVIRAGMIFQVIFAIMYTYRLFDENGAR